jgi:hypothetical protein
LRAVFADHLHRAAAAGAGGIIGRDDDFDPRQMLRQRRAAGPARLGAGALERRIGLLLLGFSFGDGLFDVVQREIELVGIELSERRPNCRRCSWRIRWRSRSF